MYHLIIFDMDGLMYDTERVMARAYLETTKEWGVRSQMADFMTLVGSVGKAICRRYHEMFGLRNEEKLTREEFEAIFESLGQDDGAQPEAGA